MAFKLRYGLPVRSDLKTISGVVATEQILNPTYIVGGGGGGGGTGPTGPTGSFSEDPIFNNISLVTGDYSTTISSSTGMTGSLNIILPPNIPDVPVSFLVSNSAGRLLWSDDFFKPTNTKYVSKTPISGQFSSIESAINSCIASSPSSDNQFLIIVMAGEYIENVLNVPSYVRITGQNQESTIISPVGDHNIFNLTSFSSLNFMSLKNSTQCGVSIIDANNFTLMHKVTIDFCNIAVKIEAATVDSQVYFEYTDFNDCSQHEVLLVDSAFENFVSLENHFIQHTNVTNQESIVVGTNGVLVYGSGSVDGGSVGKCIISNNSTSITTNNTIISNYNIGIQSTGANTTNISSNSTVMTDNTTDVVIGSTTTGYYFGILDRSKTVIDSFSSYYIYGVDSNTITVSKKGGDFNSVVQALNFIVDASAFNPYNISVGPGVFIEDQIILKPYVSIVGNSGDSSTIIISANNSQDFIIGSPSCTLKNLTLVGPPGTDHPSIVYNGSSSNTNPLIISSVIIAGGFVKQNNISGSSSILMSQILIPNSNTSPNIFNISSSNNSYNSIFVYDSFAISPSTSTNTIFDVSGTNTTGQINNSKIFGSSNATGTCISLYNGSKLDITCSRINKLYRGISCPNLGDGPLLNISSSFIDDCPSSVFIENPLTDGFIQGSIDHNTIMNDSTSIEIQTTFTDGITISGNIFFGPTFNTITDITDSLKYSTNLGKIYGGDITTLGLVCNISSGYGYLSIGTIPDDSIKFIQWNTQSITLNPNTENFLYIDNQGILRVSISSPDILTTIKIGQIYTDSSNVLYSQDTSQIGTYSTTLNQRFLTDGLGSIVSSGLITTSNGALSLDVTSGVYYYGLHKQNVSQGTLIEMDTVYRDGIGGGYINNNTTFVSAEWDNNGTLQSAPEDNYVKHALYVTNNLGTPFYLLVVGQQIFSGRAEAVEGPLPITPSFISGDIFTIAGVVVVKDSVGGSGDRITDITDIRPTIGFKSGTTTSTSDHNSLSNLVVGDAHPQYFRTDGTRTMAGDINMGGNNLTNINNLISTAGTGMSVFNHSSRHLPNGSDPLPTDIPVTIGLVNDVGIFNSFSRSDHVHAHGNQSGGSLHSLVSQTENGFMSFVDKIKLDSSTSNSTITNLSVTSMTGTNIAVTSITGGTGYFNSLISNGILIGSSSTTFDTFNGTLSGNTGAKGVNSNNSGFGYGTLTSILSTSANNTAMGRSTLAAVTSGTGNTAMGSFAGNALTTGSMNTNIGHNSGKKLTGNTNVSIGALAMENIVTGTGNVAIGYSAMGITSNGGSNNIAIGGVGTLSNVTSTSNIAIGSNTMTNLSNGGSNIAIGGGAAGSLSSGTQNIHIGINTTIGGATTSSISIGNLSTANISTAISMGESATASATGAISLGYNTFTSGTGAISIGPSTRSTAGGAITIGSNITNSTANSVSLGSSLISNIRPANNSICDLGTSSAKFKNMFTNYFVSSPSGSTGSSLSVGSAFQNPYSYDIFMTVYVNITSATSGSILLGTGPTNTPVQQTIIGSTSTTGLLSIPFYLPASYYVLISTSGTIIVSLLGQQIIPI